MAPTRPRSKSGSQSPVTQHGYEFGGPIGTALLTILLPIGCYAFTFICNDVSGCPAPALLSPIQTFSAPSFSNKSGFQHGLEVLKAETGWPGFSGLINVESILGVAAWYGLNLLLYFLLPAQEVEGVVLNTGGRLKYRFNTFLTTVVVLTACAAGTFVKGADFQIWTFIDRNFVQILSCEIIISFCLATFVFVRSFSVKPGNKQKRELAAGGHSGNIMHDWFMGRELNPRVVIPHLGEIDIKCWCELRPGMLAWLVFNLSFMAKQYRSYGYVTDSMIMVNLSQAVYILDAYYMESAILTTIDMIMDGFGFMLAFGDLAWVPFVYTIQARYLSVHPVMLGPTYVLAILAVQGLGYYIFRGSNSEKNAFRTNPNDPAVRHLQYIQTTSGSRLITSGWWGQARHINYLGDWLMSWSYCLPTLAAGYKLTPSMLHPGMRLVTTDGVKGAAIPLTYFFMVYFGILLVHRAIRDEQKCSRKYGKDWETYCRLVPYKIIPYIY